MRQQQPERPMNQASDSLNWLLLFFQSVAVACELFLHKRHGRRWLGIQGVYGLMVILLFPLLWPREDAGPLVWFMGAYVGACVLARAGVLCRGVQSGGHSFYSGTPRIMRVLPFLSEPIIKRLIEPMLVFSIGMLALSANKPLGSYLILAALGLFVSTNAAEMQMQARVQDFHDAIAEQREVDERFRQSERNDY
jgi:hypothetical protein